MGSLVDCKPLLKWPGGKRRVLPEIVKYLPEGYNTYFEPFLGGGAVYFSQQPEVAVLNDMNSELVNLYRVVRDNPDGLIDELSKPVFRNDREVFLEVRSWDRDEKLFAGLSDVVRAARMVYLNRTCFNGLYRVNSKNQFNVPFGKYSNPMILDAENIRNVSELFNSTDVSLLNGSYMDVLGKVEGEGNLVYLDPPYVPLTVTSSFTSYTKDGFGWDEQVRLRDKAKELDSNGNYVLLSNSDTPLTRELYEDFVVVPIQVGRSIGASRVTRTAVGEVLVVGRTLSEVLLKKEQFGD